MAGAVYLLATSDAARSLPYNRGMSHLDILLPFGLPPAELSADLFRELNAPALATLTSKTRSGNQTPRHETFDDFHRALPHEIWLSRQFGMAEAQTCDTSPPIATAFMQSLGLKPESETWFVLQPVHIHIARDHLVLTDPKQLLLNEAESRALFDVAHPLFLEHGKTLMYGNAGTWFVRGDEWADLQTATTDAAAGHNIDIWMPKGPGERDWRKVQNEVQMHWFNHPLNQEREARGQKPVNSLWLWGGSSASRTAASTAYAAAFNLRNWMQAFSQFVRRHDIIDNANQLGTIRGERALLVLDALLEPALASDWGRWLECMRHLETTWFAPILEHLKSGKLEQVSFILTHDSRISSLTATRSSLRKFWVKPTLASLCP